MPVVGTDDCYPKNHKGEPPALEKIRFTIRAEKCPNRRGVEAILKHFQSDFTGFDGVLSKLSSGGFDGAYLVGGYPDAWIDADTVKKFASLTTLIVQDFVRSPLTDTADVVLASATFAEREGTVVNHAGLAQLFRPALRPAQDVRTDGRLLMELAGRKGLFHSPSIRSEIAEKIPALKALACGELGELGMKVLEV
ncbi:MAG: molybdopterin-dependent oxidoreductase [Pirellulales bacterium]